MLTWFFTIPPLAMHVDDANLLTEVLDETPAYSTDLKALVLRMIHQQQGDVEQVAKQTGLPKSTLYHWLARWNLTQQKAKKKASSANRDRAVARAQK